MYWTCRIVCLMGGVECVVLGCPRRKITKHNNTFDRCFKRWSYVDLQTFKDDHCHGLATKDNHGQNSDSQKFMLINISSQCDCCCNLYLLTNQLECCMKWHTDQHDTRILCFFYVTCYIGLVMVLFLIFGSKTQNSRTHHHHVYCIYI